MFEGAPFQLSSTGEMFRSHSPWTIIVCTTGGGGDDTVFARRTQHGYQLTISGALNASIVRLFSAATNSSSQIRKKKTGWSGSNRVKYAFFREGVHQGHTL